jgi:hypothetical protein
MEETDFRMKSHNKTGVRKRRRRRREGRGKEFTKN